MTPSAHCWAVYEYGELFSHVFSLLETDVEDSPSKVGPNRCGLEAPTKQRDSIPFLKSVSKVCTTFVETME